MKKCRKNAGFTLVELLTVVAILIVLMAVAAVNVIKYQRDLKGKESDSAAKEIFIAAQNHLTAASALGELVKINTSGNTELIRTGAGTLVQGQENRYILAGPGSDALLAKMLPFGAIDEQVRSGGSYLIYYDLKTATVLDVFYSDTSDSRFGVKLEANDYYELTDNGCKGDNNRAKRRNATVHGQSKRVIGWYGGDSAAALPAYDDYLKQPTIVVSNGDTLSVTTTIPKMDNNATGSRAPQLSLIVTGCSSGAMKQYPLEHISNNLFENAQTYKSVLDDITRSSCNFANACVSDLSSISFIPGEDLLIRAVAYDNSSLSNIAESGTVRVNSLFGSAVFSDDGALTQVEVSSIRHLENLEFSVSGMDWNGDTLTVTQTSDLDWKTFYKEDWDAFVKTTEPAYPYDGENTNLSIYKKDLKKGSNGKFQYITLGQNKAVRYKGDNHQIRNLSIEGNGLFSELKTVGVGNSGVENLDLVNIYVNADAGNAGALAATANAVLTNVKAYNDGDESTLSISGTGSVGGLVGVYSGTANGCAAAVYVSGGTSAGGLFGTVGTTVNGETLNGMVSNSYSGGHTEGGKYNGVTKVENKTTSNGAVSYTYTYTINNYTGQIKKPSGNKMNVQGTTAGGLIGTLTAGTVNDCYSTCSVGSTSSTGTVGGFVGSVSSGCTVSRSYCTGLVAQNEKAYVCSKQNTENIGLFAGSNSGTLSSGDDANHCMEITNYIDENDFKKSTTQQVIPTVGGSGTGKSNVKAFDNDTSGNKSAAENYDSFVRPTTGGNNTVVGKPYDATVYNNSEKVTGGGVLYPLRGLALQNTHYGDWPIYETYVVNS